MVRLATLLEEQRRLAAQHSGDADVLKVFEEVVRRVKRE